MSYVYPVIGQINVLQPSCYWSEFLLISWSSDRWSTTMCIFITRMYWYSMALRSGRNVLEEHIMFVLWDLSLLYLTSCLRFRPSFLLTSYNYWSTHSAVRHSLWSLPGLLSHCDWWSRILWSILSVDIDNLYNFSGRWRWAWTRQHKNRKELNWTFKLAIKSSRINQISKERVK